MTKNELLALAAPEHCVGDEAEMRGLRYENARLLPLITALIEVAVAAREVSLRVPYAHSRPEYLVPLDNAIARLARVKR